MPVVDASRIPAGSAGSATLDVRPTSERPAPGDGTGAFRTVCDYSHMAFDDPIVLPGQRGQSHLHMFFGNTAVDAHTTTASLAGSGNSTCRGGIANRSSYWVPAVIDTRTGAPVRPVASDFYYKTGYAGVRPADVRAFPTGLRMIAGDAKNADDSGPFYFQCVSASYTTRTRTIPDCVPGDQVEMAITFPQCWDGVNLDSPDHQSHMAYPTSRGCPASHPVAGPEISYHIKLPVPSGGSTRAWRLSSDNYDPSRPGGYSMHADWWNGWRADIMEAFVANCDRPALDCHSHLLGDGRAID